MYEFCPHCGQTISGERVVGRTVMCEHCGKSVGTLAPPPQKVVVDATKELIRRGTARAVRSVSRSSN